MSLDSSKDLAGARAQGERTRLARGRRWVRFSDHTYINKIKVHQQLKEAKIFQRTRDTMERPERCTV